MTEDIYCKTCINKHGQPGICFDGESICHVCNNTEDFHKKNEYLTTYQQNFEKYLSAPPSKYGKYDCMLMLSGGKDSVYMLMEAINTHEKKVLAFTYDHPYESTNAAENIKRVCNALDVDHISLSAHGKYRKFMSRSLYRYQKYNALSKKSMAGNKAYYLREKQPCGICTSYILLSAYLTAFRMAIPYVLYCADPDQLEWMWIHDDIVQNIRNNKQFLGENFYNEIFGAIIDIMLEKEDEELPKVVYPFVSMLDTYDPDTLASSLKEKNLYDSNVFETHCKLWGFINYYSYKNFNTFLYASERAKKVREGIISREAEIESEKRLRKMFLDIAPKKRISEEDKRFIVETLRSLEQVPESSVGYLYGIVINTRKYAQDMGFAID